MAAAGSRPALRTAASIVALAAILAVFVLVRLPLLTVDAAPRGWNGDSAIFGLMAKKIHDGRGIDVFFWGQTYMGPLTPALAAGIRKAFLDPAGLGDASGPISLRLASMAQIAFGIALTVLAFTRLFGLTVAVAAGIWMAFGPPFLVSLSAMHRNELGPEMSFALGSVLFYLAADALTRPRPVLDRPGGRFVFGLLAGFGWWMNQTIVFVLLPVGALVLARAWRSGVRRLAAPVLAGAALGYFPVWMGRLLRWYEPADGVILLPWRLGQFPAHFARFVWSDFWKITGLEGLAPPLVLVAAAAALAAVVLAEFRRRPGPPPEATRVPSGAFALIVAVAGLGAGVYVMAGVGAFQLRYLTSALPAFLALILLALGEAANVLRRWIPAVAVTLILAVLGAAVTFFLARQARGVVAELLREPDLRAPLEAIAAQGYTVCHAGYDTAYTLQFLSDERVRFIPYHSPDRNRALSARLRAEPGPQCLVTDDGVVRRWLPSDAEQEGGPARRRAAKR